MSRIFISLTPDDATIKATLGVVLKHRSDLDKAVRELKLGG